MISILGVTGMVMEKSNSQTNGVIAIAVQASPSILFVCLFIVQTSPNY